ncbi:virulence-associated E family protein, partial [Mesorhizobium sp.]|uniref:virulence-associated E family protein n=1 Tax=Mesorhizobium sp. TaxID=1871066 RepID=UPI00122475FB
RINATNRIRTVAIPKPPLTRVQCRAQHPQPLDGYVEIISTASGDSGKNTLMETVKVLHGNLPVAFDEFTQTVQATHPLPWDKHASYPRQWTELDTIHCQLSVQALFVKPGKETVHDAVAIIANKHKRHQVREWLDALQWDGVERLPLLASQYFGTPDTPYARTIGTKFMIGAVARVMQPGCKMGNVIILEGKQGIGKSRAIAAIAGLDWFTDELPDLHNKDAAIQIAGKWIIEVSELSALKRSDVETIKKFMDRSTDRFRAPYDKAAADHPRQCVFIATTNDEHYLKDQTGNRRFWPLACSTIDVEAIKYDRDQLWVEALTRYRNGERWWLEGDETKLAEIEQEERREADPWDERITAHVASLHGMPTTFSQICFVLGIPFERLNSTVNKRIAHCLKQAGYARQQVRNGEHRTWQYVKE